MKKLKMIEISVDVAKELARVLDQMEGKICINCVGELHDAQCPAREIYQLRNYLTQRLNNPNRTFNV